MHARLPRPARHAGTAATFRIFLAAALLAALPAWSAAARPGLGFLQFSVQDLEGEFIPIGEVEFCLDDADGCLYADIDRGFPGHFNINSQDLLPDRDYTVMIYTMDVRVIYEIRGWRFVPEDYDRGWDKVLNCEKFLVYPQFRGDPQGRMEFRIDVTLNPVWEERAGAAFTIEEPDPLKFPDVLFTAQIVGQLGDRFGEDPEAGVIGASAGWQLGLTWRHGYPERHVWDEGWVTSRELTLSYGQNRYETASIMAPGRTGDVTFHRLEVSYGLSRMSQSQVLHYGVAAVLSLGGIYDGHDVLKYLDRTYHLRGVGVRGHFRKMFLSGGGLEVGAVLEAGAVYYPADTDQHDFWSGLAPTASLGLVVF
ncbi:hypothetical protein KDM41_05965 [bacterium]|nr:hypothetical protein [bacterium]